MRISDWSSDVCSSDLKNGIETKADSAYFKVAKDYTPTSPWSFNATYTYTKAVENRFFGETFAFDFPDFGGGDGYPNSYPFAPSAGVRQHRLVMTGSVENGRASCRGRVCPEV